jgi:hypothetical protein
MIKQGVANYMFSVIVGETCVDRDLLLDDQGFINLFTSLLNVEKLAMQDAIAKLISYVNENY